MFSVIPILILFSEKFMNRITCFKFFGKTFIPESFKHTRTLRVWVRVKISVKLNENMGEIGILNGWEG
jgi:hypothetical protein